MTIDEKMDEYKTLSREELRKIARSPYSTRTDSIIASVELGHRDIAEGNVYTSEEVLEHVLGKSNMACRSRRRLNSNL